MTLENTNTAMIDQFLSYGTNNLQIFTYTVLGQSNALKELSKEVMFFLLIL